MKKIIVLALVSLCLAAPAAEARRGALLDRSFGDGGKAAWPIDLGPRWEQAATAIGRLPDGGTVSLVGNNLLALRADGTPKWRFSRGPRSTSLPLFTPHTVVDLATDRQGRIVVVGTTTSPTDPSRQWVQHDESVLVARYTPSGLLDRTFGEGGLLVTDLGFAPPTIEPPPTQPMDPPVVTRGAGVAIDARGRIVLSGIRLNRIATCRFQDFVSDYFVHKDGFVARLRENGGLDPSFGQGGLAVVSETNRVQAPLLPRSGGTLLLREPTTDCYGSLQQVTRITPEGTLDAGFGPRWVMPEWERGSLALDRRGGVIVLRAGEESVNRENAQGRPDSVSF